MTRLAMTQCPAASLSAEDRALFCSDIHLHDGDAALTARFLESLQDEARHSTHLFMLGDLFEAWVGDDQDDDSSRRCRSVLSELADAGVQICLMRGNRDFLIGGRGAEAAAETAAMTTPDASANGASANGASANGAPAIASPDAPAQHDGHRWLNVAALLDDEVVIDLFGSPCLLAHGDQYCIDDQGYQAFRRLRNTTAWRAEFLNRPLEARLQLARAMREQSQREKANKAQYLMDVNPQAVEFALARAACTRLIHGHTHRPAVHRWPGGFGGQMLERWVLPDWQDAPRRGGFLRVSADGFEPVGDW